MRHSLNRSSWLFTLFAAFIPVLATAEEPTETEYFSIDAEPLIGAFDLSHIVSNPAILQANYYQMDKHPRLVVPQGSEAYLLTPADKNNEYIGYKIVGQKPIGESIEGSCYTLRRHPDQPRESVLAKFDFNVPASATGTNIVSTSDLEADFHRAKGLYFQDMWSAEHAGSAMFRHLAIKSLKQVGQTAKSTGPSWPMNRNRGVESTIRLMSGGRAISENLALDSPIDHPDSYLGELTDLSTVRGITVSEIDWQDRLSDKPTELDPLSKLVPHNQYAVYLPTFEMLAEISSRGQELAKPLVHWFEPQSRVTDVLDMYQTQLGLPMNTLTRQVGKTLVDEVAITGSDPYFRTGTDVGLLMSSSQSELLHQTIIAQVTAQSALHSNVQYVDHKIDEHVFAEWSNPSRDFCSYVALADSTVVVTNSLHQMLQILKTSRGQVKSMLDLDEYKFFRQRYVRTSKEPAALIVITDAAIRRWCSPQWRISASRRTRARATIAEASMRYADELINDQVATNTPIHMDTYMPKAGNLTLTKQGVHSKEYGTLKFQTPVAEMNLTHATPKEVDLYNRWKARYERQWRRVFDPIAVELTLSDQELTADITVIPLVLRSDYARYRSLVGKQRLKPEANKRQPDALASFSTALDTDSQFFQLARMFVNSQMRTDIDPFAWMDGSATFYFDHDEEWMKRLTQRDSWNFGSEDLLREIPIALHVPSKDSFRLAAFLIGVRSLLANMAPNTLEWRNVKYNGLEYIQATPTSDFGIANEGEQRPSFYYASTADGLTVTGNRHVMERAIDRFIARRDQPQDPANQPTPQQEADDLEIDEVETGENPDPARVLRPQIEANISGLAARAMSQSNYNSGLQRYHRIAWSNLPILNYFRSRYPDHDPADVYLKLFGERLAEPSGGEYKWNAERSTYISTNHGYHLEPAAGPTIGATLGLKDRIRSTVSFQDGGLRATLSVTSE